MPGDGRVLAVAADGLRFQPHPSVWLLVAGVVALRWYAVRVVGPSILGPGVAPVTVGQRRWFVAGVAVLWVASDWPVHDAAERYLYAVHMAQHLAFTLLMPPLFLLATPAWLARAVLGDGRLAWNVLRRLAHPVVAGVAFNAATVASHIPAVVNLSVRNGAVHYSVHLVLVATAVLMWLPVCGPLPEWRLSRPAQMLYLFLMSIVPTVPSGWLIFAETPLYRAYDIPERLFGISVVTDQQLAGLLMKLGGGLFLWSIITVLFFRWAAEDEAPTQPTTPNVPVAHERSNGHRPARAAARQTEG